MMTDFLLSQESENDMKYIIIDAEDKVEWSGNLNVINKSPGLDILPPKVLKEIKDEIDIPLKLILERSLASENSPQDLRSSHISPIYKRWKKSLSNN